MALPRDLKLLDAHQPEQVFRVETREEIMPYGGGGWGDFLGILAVVVLVATNGFFVAAEFALVALPVAAGSTSWPPPSA